MDIQGGRSQDKTTQSKQLETQLRSKLSGESLEKKMKAEVCIYKPRDTKGEAHATVTSQSLQRSQPADTVTA